MTYTATKHITKTGRLSTNYNVIDEATGLIVGCCISRKSAIALSQRLNYHDSILSELEERYSTTITEVDWSTEESGDTYYEVLFQKDRGNDVSERSVGCNDNRQNISRTRIREHLRHSETRGLCQTAERVAADNSTDAPGSEIEISELPVFNGLTVSETRIEIPVITSREQLEKSLNQAITGASNFFTDSLKLATESRQLATESRQLATESRQLASGCLQVAQIAVGVAAIAVGELSSIHQEPIERQLEESCIDITNQTTRIQNSCLT